MKQKDEKVFTIILVVVCILFIIGLYFAIGSGVDRARQACEDAGGAYVSSSECVMPYEGRGK